MPDFKPVPEGAKSLILHQWYCGDDCCCSAYQVRAVFPCTHPKTPHYMSGKDDWTDTLWESGWFNPVDNYFWETGFPQQELRQEVAEACRFYGIEADLSGDCYDRETTKDL